MASLEHWWTIRAAGTAVAFAWSEGAVPRITHWGRDYPGDDWAGDLAATDAPAVFPSSVDIPRSVSCLPSQADAWSGTPALSGTIAGAALTARLVSGAPTLTETSATFALTAVDGTFTLLLRYALDTAGVLRASVTITNRSDRALDLGAARIMLPLPGRAQERLDLTGRWTGERRPQRSAIGDGTHYRGARRGRTGHDAPLLEIAGTRGFAFGTGEVWAAHVAWSGDSEHFVERLPEGAGVHTAMLGGGELLAPGEIALQPGDLYASPDVVLVWSEQGIDGLSSRLHASIRSRPAYPTTPRPVLLNTWEAVFFDHDFATLSELAGAAAAVGVERFVLDDGWFLARRDDQAGLGDWFVDRTVWPDGLAPLASVVHGLGLEFGLWFEPEMVNLDSDLARAHPHWLLAPQGEPGLPFRNQYVVNLAHEDAWQYLLERISTLVTEIGIDYIKWDHNRDLHEAVDRRTGRAAVHAQTAALYRLLDELHRRHPGLEIETCASGGGRVDLGILDRTQRLWASDTIDAIERQQLEQWTSVLVPPELIGSHAGPARALTTRRVLDAPIRFITPLFGHAGLEWDLRHCSPDELAMVAAFIRRFTTLRGDLATGRMVNGDDLPDGAVLRGFVSADGGKALYSWAQLAASPSATSERIRLPGLDVTRRYRITIAEDFGPASRRSHKDPRWMSEGTTQLGALLTTVGLPLPALDPGQAVLVEVVAVD